MKIGKDCLIGLSSAYISSDNASFIPVALAARPPTLAQIFLPSPRGTAWDYLGSLPNEHICQISSEVSRCRSRKHLEHEKLKST